jgi:hypothetical protein
VRWGVVVERGIQIGYESVYRLGYERLGIDSKIATLNALPLEHHYQFSASLKGRHVVNSAGKIPKQCGKDTKLVQSAKTSQETLVNN